MEADRLLTKAIDRAFRLYHKYSPAERLLDGQFSVQKSFYFLHIEEVERIPMGSSGFTLSVLCEVLVGMRDFSREVLGGRFYAETLDVLTDANGERTHLGEASILFYERVSPPKTN